MSEQSPAEQGKDFFVVASQHREKHLKASEQRKGEFFKKRVMGPIGAAFSNLAKVADLGRKIRNDRT